MPSSLVLRRLGALGVLAVAGGVAVGSGADFTAQSATPASTFTAGTLSIGNSNAATAILSVTNLRPGGPAQNGVVDIQNTGSIPGTFSVAASGLTDTPASPALSGKLDLVINDCGLWSGGTAPSCASPTVKYSGKLGAMTTAALGTYAASDKHRYQFSVTFPDGGTAGADNGYQGGQSSVVYTFNAVS